MEMQKSKKSQEKVIVAHQLGRESMIVFFNKQYSVN